VDGATIPINASESCQKGCEFRRCNERGCRPSGLGQQADDPLTEVGRCGCGDDGHLGAPIIWGRATPLCSS